MKLLSTTLLALLLTATADAQAEAQAPKQQTTRDTPTENEELAIAALEGLMAQPSDRALPILKKVLAGPQSTLVKRRALFVLSQVDSQEARDILLQTARSSNAELRQEAIRSLGIGGDPKALDALRQIYDAGDADAKQSVLQAWLIAGRKDAVYEVAANAKSEEEASDAIRMLGAMGASEELRKLGERSKPTSGLLDAYAISGDLASLRRIAEGGGEPAMRVDAVRRIGIIGTDAARATLRDIYTRSTDESVKDAALQGMLIAGDDKGVLELYRVAKTSDEKRTLLRTLTMMGSDAALEAIDATLEKQPTEKKQ
jgi:HEAT repeat protein